MDCGWASFQISVAEGAGLVGVHSYCLDPWPSGDVQSTPTDSQSHFQAQLSLWSVLGLNDLSGGSQGLSKVPSF